MRTNPSLAFTGARRDAISAGYPLGNGYRTYLPGLMRFNAPDSLSPFGPGGVNAYAYCAGDPIHRSDPTGHIGFRAFFSGIRKAVSGRVEEGSGATPLIGDTESIAARDAAQPMETATRHSIVPEPTSQPPDSDSVAGASYRDTGPVRATYDFVNDENHKTVYDISLAPTALPPGYNRLSILGDSVGGGAFRLYKENITLDFGDTKRTYGIDGGTALPGKTEQWLLAAIRSPLPHLNDRLLVIGLGKWEIMGDMEEGLRSGYYIYGKEKATVNARFGAAQRIASRSGERTLVPVNIDKISFRNAIRTPWYER